MTRLVTIEQLLEKPVCMMSGEEFVLLLQNAEKGTAKAPAEVVPERHYEHGIAGIAKIFGCSIPTANRIKKSGVIDPAITQVARKIVIDVELALELAKKQVALHLSESSMEEDWKDNLSTDAKGNTLKTISNLRMIFTHDENLRQIRFDTFCQDDISFSPLFRNVNGNKVDEESVGKIQDYLEQNYDLRLTQNKVFEILKTTASERNFNPVQDYICKEKWDGNPRIETAIIDYLGAEDTPLIREQTKLWFVAAVARAFEPGCKFDNVLTLPGPQGIGKARSSKLLETDGSTTLFRSQVVTRKRLRLSRMVGLSR